MNQSSTLMPPPLPALPSTYTQVLELRESEIYAAYDRGDHVPVIFPYHWLPFLAVVLYLFLEPSHSRILRVYRYASFVFFSWSTFRCMQLARSPTPVIAYGMGLVSAWAIMWIAALIIFNDVKSFRRVWAVCDAPPREKLPRSYSISKINGTTTPAAPRAGDHNGQEIRRRLATQRNESMGRTEQGREDANGSPRPSPNEFQRASIYYWQSIPKLSLKHRFYWLFDLTTSLRGPGWEHQIRSIPTPPDHILVDLPLPHPRARPTVKSYVDRSSLLWHNGLIFAFAYLCLDILKCISVYDPFFWGQLDAELLPQHPLSGIGSSPLALRVYRSILTLSGIGVALRAILALNALVFAGIFKHDNKILRLGIHADPWAYPNWWGSPMWLASHGLAGWWGAWWHQIFRLGFEAPTSWLCRQLKWDRQSKQAKTLGVVIAFSFSGILHAGGSFTSWPDTKPMLGSFAFFALQGVGSILEDMAKQQLRKTGLLEKLPIALKRVFTVLWVLSWTTLTAPLLVNDLARSGIWLFEPVPFSLTTFFRYRTDRVGLWAWRGQLFWWHRGDSWWQSGVAF